MRTDIARWLTGILGIWLVSWGLTFAALASTDASAPQGTTSCAHHALELALSAPLSNALGGGDHESVLDEQDPPEAGAPTLSREENAQPLVAANAIWHQRAALPARSTHHIDSLSLVEPRFLRYSRLLN
ncbi:MAG TPA: hypothetical protein VEI74_06535 [Candidatus Methylomirabilis sp.]|nr:hypothetical protein [Candidatus Methylomirabilis sp.]